LRVLISFALLFISAIAAADENALVGKWESVGRSEGGLGATLQLNADGSLASAIGAMVDYTYSIDRGKLKTVFVDPETGKTKVTKNAIRFEGDDLIEKNGGGPRQDLRMTRQTPADTGNPILGTWKYPHSSGATAFVTFTRDGREILRIPLKVDGGSWVAVDNRLTLRVGGKEPVTVTYHIDGGMLTTVKDAKEFRYRRVRY
jgi:hypothetical protein